uniref:Tubulin--tyrosine ligase-like protein 5 n=1 Tax=Leptobrachium leishanense TaxID=445787 RepID=A0A8C5M9U3_9ANUR
MFIKLGLTTLHNHGNKTPLVVTSQLSLHNDGWGEYPYIAWTGSSQEIPVVRFQANADGSSGRAMRKVGEHYHLSYKISPHSSPLIRQILSRQGFQEAKKPEGFNLMWVGLNIERMQKKFGSQHFNFMPKSYVLPEQYDDFSDAISRDQGFWIKKPVNSSQGLGIKVIRSLHEVRKVDRALVSQYIANPFLVNGYKFDFRLYILVTSYDPLTIYMYKEGLTRFATERYNLTDLKTKGEFNKFMHLTNSSLNKKSPNYTKNSDQQMESGSCSMWTFSAMLRYLKEVKQIDTDVLMSQIEDIVIKTIISAEGPITTACRSKVPHKNNCFELYGFDILVDENLKPWLLEVNLSPALTTGSPMDTKVKANLVADTLTLVGVECQDSEQKNVALSPSMGYYRQRYIKVLPSAYLLFLSRIPLAPFPARIPCAFWLRLVEPLVCISSEQRGRGLAEDVTDSDTRTAQRKSK